MDETTLKIVEFLKDIGLNVEEEIISNETFLPGIAVKNGALIVDAEKLKYPGDLLHEAGHLAVLSAQDRMESAGDFPNDGGEEMGAIAWSYAACVHIGLSVKILFHDDGYKGNADSLADLFTNGPGLAIPFLEWKGLTTSKGENKYPKMTRWLCP